VTSASTPEDELENGGGFIENGGCVGVSAETSRLHLDDLDRASAAGLR